MGAVIFTLGNLWPFGQLGRNFTGIIDESKQFSQVLQVSAI